MNYLFYAEEYAGDMVIVWEKSLLEVSSRIVKGACRFPVPRPGVCNIQEVVKVFEEHLL